MMCRMPLQRLARCALAAALSAGLLVGCGDDGEISRPVPPEQLTGVDTDQPARQVLARAVARLRKRDTGTFNAAIGANRDSGRFRLSARSAVVTRTVSAGSTTAFSDSARTPGGVWLRVRTPAVNEKRACWVRSGDALGETTGGIPGAYAGAVGAALTARGRRWDREEIVGSVNLAQAMLTVDLGITQSLRVAAVPDARVPASFLVRDGELLGWRTTGAQLLGAMAKAGLKADGELEAFGALDESTIDVQFADLGLEVDVSAPAPDRVIAALPADTLLKRAKVCARRK